MIVIVHKLGLKGCDDEYNAMPMLHTTPQIPPFYMNYKNSNLWNINEATQRRITFGKLPLLIQELYFAHYPMSILSNRKNPIHKEFLCEIPYIRIA